MVDLGLPSGLKWAKCNVGAEKETDYGLFFKFGDVTGHTSEECTHLDGSIPAVELDSNNNLLPAYDAATQLMGADYRMPTKGEFQELVSNTDHASVTIDGVNGLKFISKVDSSKYIFVPLPGTCAYGGFDITVGFMGGLWSSTRCDDGNAAYYLYNDIDARMSVSGEYMPNGHPIRAVSK